MVFDISQVDESLRADLTAWHESEVKKSVDAEVSGLKGKNDELLGKVTAGNAQLAELQATADRFKVLGDHDPAELMSVIQNLEQGKIDEALKAAKGDPSKLQEVVNMQLSKEKKAWEEQANGRYGELEGKFNDLTASHTALTEQVKVMSLDEVSKSVFLRQDDANKAAADVVAEQVRKVFTLGEDGKPVALDAYDQPRLNAKGEPLTIEEYVTGDLREEMSFFYAPAVGGQGKGSKGASSSNFGTGITERVMSKMSEFMEAGRALGKTDAELLSAWQALPAPSKST